jgi:hypothetical protein
MRNLRWRSAVGASLTAVAACAAMAGGAFAGGNPPGANGTIKLDDKPFDSHPNNEPHVGCVFQVDFYGFDKGNYNANVTFTIQPPSGKGRVVRRDTVFIGQDNAGGGTDLDAERTYDLNMDVFSYERHPKQGFHIKVDVQAPGAGGKVAKKSKVFWARDCIDP